MKVVLITLINISLPPCYVAGLKILMIQKIVEIWLSLSFSLICKEQVEVFFITLGGKPFSYRRLELHPQLLTTHTRFRVPTTQVFSFTAFSLHSSLAKLQIPSGRWLYPTASRNKQRTSWDALELVFHQDSEIKEDVTEAEDHVEVCDSDDD